MKKKLPVSKVKNLHDLADQAMKEAFRDLVLEKRKTGGSLIFWRDNKVVEVPASKVRLPK